MLRYNHPLNPRSRSRSQNRPKIMRILYFIQQQHRRIRRRFQRLQPLLKFAIPNLRDRCHHSLRPLHTSHLLQFTPMHLGHRNPIRRRLPQNLPKRPRISPFSYINLTNLFGLMFQHLRHWIHPVNAGKCVGLIGHRFDELTGFPASGRLLASKIRKSPSNPIFSVPIPLIT